MPVRWSEVELRLSAGNRVRCEAGWELAPAWWRALQDFDLWFVWAGRGRMQLDERAIDLRPGVCLWMRPGCRYEATHDPSDRLGVTFIHFDLIDRASAKRGRDRRIPFSHLPAQVHRVSDVSYVDAVLKRVIDLTRPTALALAQTQVAVPLMTGLLMDLDLGTLELARGSASPAEQHHHQVVASICTRISESPKDCPSVAALAGEAGYCPDHFSRVFKQIVGMSPQQFRLRSRMDRARQLLAESSMTVGEVADALGYADVYFFSRQFKQQVGVSPRSYRQRRGP